MVAPVQVYRAREGSTRRSAYEVSVIAVLTLCASLVFLNRVGIAFLFPTIKPQLDLNNAQLGQLMAATSVAWAISSVGGSLISDALAIRPRVLLVLCVVMFSIVGALGGFVHSFRDLLVLRVAMGVFEGPVMPLIQSVVSGLSPMQRRGANLGIVIGTTSLVAGVLAPSLMSGLAIGVGWRFAFVAIAAPGPLIALAAWFTMRPRADTPVVILERLDLKSALRQALRRNVLFGVVGAITLIGAAATTGAFLPVYLASIPAFSPSQRVYVLVAVGVSAFIGAVVTPALSDCLGRKRVLMVACLGAALAPVAMILMSFSSFWWVPAVLLNLIASGALTLMVFVVPGEAVSPRMTTSTFAVLLCVGEIFGGAMGPTVAGWVADRLGLMSAFWIPCALGVVALLGSLFVRDRSATTE